MKLRSTSLSLVFVFQAALPMFGQGLQTVNLTVPSADPLTVTFPATWQKEVRQTADLPPTLKLTAPGLSLQISFMAVADDRFSVPQAVDAVVTAGSQHYVAGSIEQTVSLTQLASARGHGSYATFTDAKHSETVTPPPGNFRNVATGVLVINREVAAFTLLSNDPHGRDYLQAMQVITDGIAPASK